MNRSIVAITISFCCFFTVADAQDVKKLFNRGYHYLSVDTDEAIRILGEVIDLDSTYAEAYYFRGIANYKLEKYYSSLSDFDKAIQFDPALDLVNVYRGFIYRKLQEVDSALFYFNKYIESNPQDTSAYDFVLRGKLNYEAGELDAAIEDFQRALDMEPIKESYHYYKYVAYFDNKQFSKAINQIDQAIELNPNFYGYYYFKGNAYYQLEEYQKAVSEYSIALELDIHNADLYYHRGLAEHALENIPEAIRDYDTAIAYNPRDGTYFFQRGYAKLANGDKLGACDDWYVAGSLGYYADFEKIKEVCE